MGKVAILTANLGGFDKVEIPKLSQSHDYNYHCFDDNDFPPIEGLSSRFQYRIPKLFGFEMHPGFDKYIWIDGSMSLQHEDSVQWFLDQLGDADLAFFKHPWRNTIKEEVDHIEEHLRKGKEYITSRYKNGLHKEEYKMFLEDKLPDNCLFASTAFIYKNNAAARTFLRSWWYLQSRYYSCDQIALTHAIVGNLISAPIEFKAKIKTIEEDVFKIPYITLSSKHK